VTEAITLDETITLDPASPAARISPEWGEWNGIEDDGSPKVEDAKNEATTTADTSDSDEEIVEESDEESYEGSDEDDVLSREFARTAPLLVPHHFCSS